MLRFVTSKMFLPKVHAFTWASPDGRTHSQVDHPLIKEGIQMYDSFSLSGSRLIQTIMFWRVPLNKQATQR
jgi:hypothetical protein